nr:GNAT family N-acetyltransferase [Halomarina sp. PSR21]
MFDERRRVLLADPSDRVALAAFRVAAVVASCETVLVSTTTVSAVSPSTMPSSPVTTARSASGPVTLAKTAAGDPRTTNYIPRGQNTYPMAARLPLWRVTRTARARRLYEWLAARGVTGARMYQYVRDLDEGLPAPAPPADVTLARESGADAGLERLDGDLARDDTVVVARSDDGGEAAGQVVVSVGRPVRVPPLGATVRTDGAYVWRLYVPPAHRGRGIATALVAAGARAARERGADRAAALVATDNRPSQRVFEANGFEARTLHTYYRFRNATRRGRRRLR